jgi:hypothetical protein
MPVSVPAGMREVQKLVIDWVSESLETPSVSPDENFLVLGGSCSASGTS